MKIAAVSDLHVRPSGADDALIEAIWERVSDIGPDLFIVAGDVSEQVDVLEDVLSRLRYDCKGNLYVAGNHDVWFEEENGLTSLEKYSYHIGNACDEAGFIHLPDKSWTLGNIGFVGSLGWADYSFGREDLRISKEQYRAKEYKGATWNDVFNIDWEFSDEEATDLFNRKLQYDLSILPDSIDSIVYVSHHLPFKELTVYKDRLPWDFFSAYMGARSTGQILLDDERVVLSISGHSHIRNQIQINGITAITVPIGYGRPADDDFESLAYDAVAVIEIHERSVSLLHFVEGDICAGMPYVF